MIVVITFDPATNQTGLLFEGAPNPGVVKALLRQVSDSIEVPQIVVPPPNGQPPSIRDILGKQPPQ